VPPKGKQKRGSLPRPKPNQAVELLVEIRDFLTALLEKLPGPPPPDACCANCHYLVQGEVCRRRSPQRVSSIIPGGAAKVDTYWCGDWCRKRVSDAAL
jgi:hypothetical protein